MLTQTEDKTNHILPENGIDYLRVKPFNEVKLQNIKIWELNKRLKLRARSGKNDITIADFCTEDVNKLV